MVTAELAAVGTKSLVIIKLYIDTRDIPSLRGQVHYSGHIFPDS